MKEYFFLILEASILTIIKSFDTYGSNKAFCARHDAIKLPSYKYEVSAIELIRN